MASWRMARVSSQSLRTLGGDVADEDRGGRVAAPAVELDAAVDPDHVAVLDDASSAMPCTTTSFTLMQSVPGKPSPGR